MEALVHARLLPAPVFFCAQRHTQMHLLALFTTAQYHPDPFAGSNCTCESFCAGGCAINATPAQNITLWRMSPGWRGVRGTPVLDLTNKNTGDAIGVSLANLASKRFPSASDLCLIDRTYLLCVCRGQRVCPLSLGRTLIF